MNDNSLKNLEKGRRFKSEDEATKAAGKKGGIASGRVRGFRNAAKQKVKENPDIINAAVSMLVVEAIQEHNLKALELLLELVGEDSKADDKKMRAKEFKLKERELQLKEDMAKNKSDDSQDILSKLDDVLGEIKSGF